MAVKAWSCRGLVKFRLIENGTHFFKATDFSLVVVEVQCMDAETEWNGAIGNY